MDISARRRDNVVVLDLIGNIDVNSANLVEAVGQCIHDGYTDIILNFEDIEVVDYLGMSAIALAYKEVINYNGRMKFTNLSAQLKHLFSVSGLDRVVDIYALEDLAVNSFKEDKVIENIKKLQLRRRFKRIPLDIKVELKEKTSVIPKVFKVDILNLSAIGAYIYGCDKFKLGDEVILSFKLPPKSDEVRLEAKVVWLSDRQIQPHGHPGIGIEFVNVPCSIQEKLLEYIDRNLSFLSSDDQSL